MIESLHRHLRETARGVERVYASLPQIERWASDIAPALLAGNTLFAAGNGGSAAEAQHLTAELVGRYRSERRPLSAIPLHGDASAVTAIANDYGPASVFARQVQAHGRRGDKLILLSTSGRSENLVAAAAAARELDVESFALTGSTPNPLASICDRHLAIEGCEPPAVQEMHLVVIHLLCESIDRIVAGGSDHAVQLLSEGSVYANERS
jgi:phosphoheptose isomerase